MEHAMQNHKTPLAVVTTVLFAVATMPALAQHAELQSAEQRAAVPAIPYLTSESLLVVVSPQNDAVWAYSKELGSWWKQTLATPPREPIRPIVSGQVAIFQAGDRTYAFSAAVPRRVAMQSRGKIQEGWAMFESDPKAELTIMDDWAWAVADDRIYAFSAKDGRWAGLDVKASIATEGSGSQSEETPAVQRPMETSPITKWKLRLGRSYNDASPSMAPNGVIYVATFGGAVVALTRDGRKTWEFQTGDPKLMGLGWTAPAVGPDGTIYVGVWNRKALLAIRSDGTLLWECPAGANVDTAPAIASDGTIYFGSDDACVYAVSQEGTVKWKFETGGTAKSSPSVAADGTIYVGSSDHNLYALDRDGSKKWAFRTDGVINSSPAIAADGTIYVGSDDGYAYAINSSGSLRWRLHVGECVRAAPLIAEDGSIYVYGANGWFYALEGSAGPARSAWPMFRNNARRTGCP
jgi:outer membrane protein assembly factor BamB